MPRITAARGRERSREVRPDGSSRSQSVRARQARKPYSRRTDVTKIVTRGVFLVPLYSRQRADGLELYHPAEHFKF